MNTYDAGSKILARTDTLYRKAEVVRRNTSFDVRFEDDKDTIVKKISTCDIKHILCEGDKVEAKFKGKGMLYPGKVYKVNRDGTYDVKFDNGNRDKAVHREKIKAVGDDDSHSTPPKKKTEKKKSKIREGDNVEAKFKGKGKFYPGEVYKINRDGTYDVKFADGDRDRAVEADDIKAVGEDDETDASDKFEDDDNVEARYRGKARYYPGKVSRVRSSEDSEDGDSDTHGRGGNYRAAAAAAAATAPSRARRRGGNDDSDRDSEDGDSDTHGRGGNYRAAAAAAAATAPSRARRRGGNDDSDRDSEDGDSEDGDEDNYTDAFQPQTSFSSSSSSSSSSSLGTPFDNEIAHLQRKYSACKKKNEFEALSLNRQRLINNLIARDYHIRLQQQQRKSSTSLATQKKLAAAIKNLTSKVGVSLL